MMLPQSTVPTLCVVACVSLLAFIAISTTGGLSLINTANEREASRIERMEHRIERVERRMEHPVREPVSSFSPPNPIAPLTRPAEEGQDLDPGLMIAKAGYPSQTFAVTTPDGYLLRINRIPPNIKGPGKGHPVLLQHGLISSSADWLILGRGKALPYLLADEGYDVWLGNIRGNTYSRAHTNLSTASAEYWSFSFQEMGYTDVPAITDFILAESGHPQLSYVGHSMGTTMFWIFCATQPKLQHRIRQMHALAPIAFMSKMKSPLATLAPVERTLQVTLNMLGEYEFLRHDAVTGFLEQEFLKLNHIGPKGVEYMLFFIAGASPDQFNQTLLPKMLGHSPAGASTQTLLHYLQGVNSAKFRKYDYGTPAANLIKYGSPTPPEYDLSLLDVPIYMHYSLNDYLANVEDVKELYSHLKSNAVTMMQVPLRSFNHLDFMWGNDAKTLVYEPVIAALNKASLRAQLADQRFD